MGSNHGGKVRIVARIRGQPNKHSEIFDGVSVSKNWISVSKPNPELNPNSRSSRVKISFGSDQTSSGKQSYELDECYEQEVENKEIFTREVKPLISGLFKGHNSTVFAYGPRGSGKTHTIQGCEEDFGLAILSVDAILPQAEEQGKIITVSVFEVHQDRVSDLLDSSRSDVSVFEDAQGKIRLKGLSKTKVNSTLEFQSLYLQATNIRKQLQNTIEPIHRSHIGCIVHIVSPQTDKSNAQLVGKISFIDLASYEDSRRKSSDGFNTIEATKINKSLYAVHNVLYALNAKEARVPYRESKLTRMLQDSLGGMSKIVMITCMNPSLCQETVQTISLASRSCMAGFLACLDPGKSIRSASKTFDMSSPRVPKSASKSNIRSNMMSPKVVKPPMSASASGKKQVKTQLSMSMKRAKNAPIEAKGRLLFDDACQKKSNVENKCPENTSVMESSAQTEENKCPEHASVMESSSQREIILSVASETDNSKQEAVMPIVSVVPTTPTAYETPQTENFPIDDKENKSYSLNEAPSPPLSARIRELSNNLKSLCFSTEANLKMVQESSNLVEQVIDENMEPNTPTRDHNKGDDDKYVIHENLEFKTPNVESCTRAIEKYDNLASPWQNFHKRGTGIKDSLVNECLKFINSASKDELKALKGIGEKRATYIIEMREESPEPFKQLDDLKEIGLTTKQIDQMMKSVVGDILT